jgi:hypothetical protein
MTRLPCLFACITALTIASPLAAKESLGVYDGWGAFRDAGKTRCYAIAQPRGAGSSGAFASVATWPRRGVRGQVHIRLSRPVPQDSAPSVRIGGRGRDAWALDEKGDAAIIAAMRSNTAMRVRAAGFSERYDLEGVATAIDAAVVGCANR